MQVLPIILVAVVMAADADVTLLGHGWLSPPYWAWLVMTIPPAMIVWAAWLVVRVNAARLRQTGRVRWLIKAERAARWARMLIVVNHIVAIAVLNGLGAVRALVGNTILVDELITIIPAMIGLLMTWWAFYPVERLVLESAMIRRMDDGAPIYPPPTRWRYVLVQARMQVLLTLIPVLAIAGLSEAIDDVWFRADASESAGAVGLREVFTILAAAGVFLVSPLIARIVLDTQSLPAGPLREDLTDVCRRHRVGVRDLLLWNTNGSSINAAVMGLIAPLRYVLITDALLETLREDEVRAVMAHEVGHVRRRHMAWMVLCLLACFIVAAYLVDWPLRWAHAVWRFPASWIESMTLLSAALQLAIGLTAFGWVCRRFERQADTFAVQHLSGLGTAAEPEARVTIESVDAMRGALETIAQLNTIDPSRHSWRHGSIRWRQLYLDSIIGRPIQSLPIDRLVSIVKVLALLIVMTGIAQEIFVRQDDHARQSAIQSSMIDHNVLNGDARGLQLGVLAPT